MQKRDLVKRIQALEGISSPSDSLDRILDLAADYESGIDDLREAIESDPAVTSKVLRLSNSAYFGVPGGVETVSRAIVVIGYKNVLSLATCAALSPMFRGDDEVLDRAALWGHSCATAEAAQLVAARSGIEPSAAYVAGLIHDLGVVVLSEILGDDYGKALRAARGSGEPLAAAERRELGADHAWTAGELFQRWTLPPRLLAAATLHPAPLDDPTRFALLVAVAGWLAASSGFPGPTGLAPTSGLPDEWLVELGLGSEDLKLLQEEFEERRGAAELAAGVAR